MPRDAISVRPNSEKRHSEETKPPQRKAPTPPNRLGEFSYSSGVVQSKVKLSSFGILSLALISIFLFGLVVFGIIQPSQLQAEAAKQTGPSTEISSWTLTAPLPQGVAGRNLIVSGDDVYLLGGRDNNDGSLNTIYRASILGNGSLSEWLPAGNLPKSLYLHAVVQYNNYIYVIGGWNANESSSSNRPNNGVWRGELGTDGTIGNWVATSTYPTKVTLHQAVIVNQRVFVIGGYANIEKKPLDTVYFADIDTSTGLLGDWQLAPSLPQPVRRAAAVTTARNGVDYIYVTGGSGADTESAFNTVYYSTVGADGSLGAWQPTTTLPNFLSYHAVVIHDGRVTVLGGRNSNGEYSSVYGATINNDGSLGSWDTLTSLPASLYRFGAASVRKYGSDFIIVAGGFVGDSAQSAVRYSTVPNTPTPTVTPTPTDTPTPIPSPTPTPALSIEMKSDPVGWVGPGEEIEYTIEFTAPPVSLEDVSIDTLLPDNMVLIDNSIAASGEYEHTITENSINWLIGSLDGDAVGQVSYSMVRPTPTSPDSNTPAVLELSLFGPTSANSGQLIEYRLELKNNSVIPLPDITVKNRLPYGAVYIDGSGAGLIDGDVTWGLPVLPPLATETFTYTVTSNTTLYNTRYLADSKGGPNGVGYTILTTNVENNRPIVGDGFKIVHEGAQASWTVGESTLQRKTDIVVNPFFQYFLPVQDGGKNVSRGFVQ